MSDRESYDGMADMAFAIADRAMIELVQSEFVNVCGVGVVWAPVNVAGLPVMKMEDADPRIVEAVEWLELRCLAEVVESENGDTLILKEGDENVPPWP